MSGKKVLILKDSCNVEIENFLSLSEVYHWVLTQSSLNVKRIKSSSKNE